MIETITPYIFSKLGNSSSLLPIFVKDAGHTAGMTTAAYITGKEVEGKDRFIDEIGTQAIWIGGIPFYKKVIDHTLYKLTKYNPNIDVRLLKDANSNGKIAKGSVLAKAIFNTTNKKTRKEILKAAKNAKIFKGLTLAKFIISTALTMASYAALTNFRHKHTEKAIIEEIKKEENAKKTNQKFLNEKTPLTFKAFEQKPKNYKNPSFGGININTFKDFMFNPVKNMMIVDGGITGQRLAEARNPQDFLGYVIKEGSFWAFMYFAGTKIQEHFEKIADKKGKSIGLDIKALEDPVLKEAFENQELFDKNMKEFVGVIDKTKETVLKKGKKTRKIISQEKNAKLYDFLCTKNNNLVVRMAKKSETIKTLKENGMVDTQKFIDLDEVVNVYKKLKKLNKQYKKYGNGKINEFMQDVIKLKKGSILKNIGSCLGVLGVVVPGMMLIMRYVHKDNKEFQVKKEIKEQLLSQMN